MGKAGLAVALGVIVVGVVLIVALLVGHGGGKTAGSTTTMTPAALTHDTVTAQNTTTVPTAASIPSGVYIVILGTTACPHCRAEKSFFESEMPGIAYFCNIDSKHPACSKAFAILFQSGVTSGTPTNVVCNANTSRIVAIVVGELRSVEAWKRIFSSRSNETTIPVYYGERLAGYLKAKSLESVSKLYNALCVDTINESERLG